MRELYQIARKRGAKVPELDIPPCPDSLKPLVGVFYELRSSRTIDLPLSYGDLRDYQELTGVTLSPLIVSALRRLDSAYRKEALKDGHAS